MTEQWPVSPWVAEYRAQVGFALQVFPLEERDDPAGKMLAAGRLAEELGFDAFFCGDHPAWGPDPWLHMAALAADLDNLSGGRLILGLGCGWDANEFANLGLPFPSVSERQAALEEAIAIIRGAWGDQPFTFAGRFFQTANAHVTPPLHRPGPPLLLAGGGERVTLRQVAQYADACQLGSFGMVSGTGTTAEIARKLAVLRGHCEAIGRPYDTVLRTHFTGWLILAEDEARLQAKVQSAIPDGIDARFSGPWAGFAVAATVEQAIATYREMANTGIQYFVVETLDADDEETMRLLAERVIPEVKGESCETDRRDRSTPET